MLIPLTLAADPSAPACAIAKVVALAMVIAPVNPVLLPERICLPPPVTESEPARLNCPENSSAGLLIVSEPVVNEIGPLPANDFSV